MRKLLAVVVIALCSAMCSAVYSLGAHAADALPTESALDKRVSALSQDLRCLVCQNQTIADSQAPLAIDLKNQIREKIAQGMSNDQIIDYMVQRYGDFVLYRPPVKAATLALLFGPAVLLVLGLVVLFRHLARRRSATDAPLTDAERKRARALLGPIDTDKEPK